MASTKPRSNRNAQARLDALVRLRKSDGPLTKAALGLSSYFVSSMIEEGVLAQAKDRHGKPVVQKVTDASGKPTQGHPANLYKLTSKGASRAKRAIAKQETATA